MNNPFRYTDPTGYTWWSHFWKWTARPADKILNAVVNIAVDLVVAPICFTLGIVATVVGAVEGIGQGIFSGGKNWTIFRNDMRIFAGLFDGSAGQILSRFTAEWPQTMLGYLVSQSCNIGGQVKDVRYFHGATIVEHYGNNHTYTLGSYINLAHEDAYNNNVHYNDNENPNVLHEYGHYLQSQVVGPSYLFNYAIPSLINAGKTPQGNLEHNAFWVEQDADIRARKYFGDSHWDYTNYFILGDPKNPSNINYSDYENYYNYMGSNWFDKVYKWLDTAKH